VEGFHHTHKFDVKVFAVNVRKLLTVESARKFLKFVKTEILAPDVLLLSETNLSKQEVLDEFTTDYRVCASKKDTKGGALVLVKKFGKMTLGSKKFQVKAEY